MREWKISKALLSYATALEKTHWLRRWVQSPAWFFAFVLSSIIALMTYLFYSVSADVYAGSDWGIAYGLLATIFLVASAAFSLRRRLIGYTVKYRAGRAQTWLQLHVYGGSLFLLLVLLHTGFTLPTGSLTAWLFYLSIWVTLSGSIGTTLQRVIPKILASGLSVEVLYERIPSLIREIREKTDRLAHSGSDTLRDFYEKNIAPTLVAPQPKLIYYLDITGGIHSSVKRFDHVSRLLPQTERQKLAEIERHYKTKLELDAHYTLQQGLRWWLYLHVPPSLLLLFLVGLHIYSILYY